MAKKLIENAFPKKNTICFAFLNLFLFCANLSKRVEIDRKKERKRERERERERERGR